MNTGSSSGKQIAVKKLTVDGRDIQAYVSTDGTFYAHWDPDEDYLFAPSIKELEKKLRDKLRTKATRVEVEVTLIDKPAWNDDPKNPVLADARLTGIHAGHGGPIFVGPDGTISRRDVDVVCRRLTDEEKAHYLELWRQKRVASEALEKLEEKWELDPVAAVRKAAGEKTKAERMKTATAGQEPPAAPDE